MSDSRETHILLVRHPQTEANVNGRYVGRGDSPFTAEGLAQLNRVPARILEFQPEHVWASPLERARLLAERVAELARLSLATDERLCELDFGAVEGMTYAEIEAAGLTFNYRDLETPVAPGGESRAQIEARSAQFCDELVARGGRHVVVTHGGVFRASLVHLLGLVPTAIWAFHIHNAQLGYVRVVEGHGMLEEYVRG